jgi:hypothetical protein
MYRLDVAPVQEPGQCIRYIKFASLRQARYLGDRSFAIEQQEHPAFPAWELAGKRRCLEARGKAERSRGIESALLCLKVRSHHLSPSSQWRWNMPSQRPSFRCAKTTCVS